MKHRFFAICLGWLLASACSEKKASAPPVMAIREMGDLATTEYVVTKMVKANDDQTWYKWGDRKILMSCRATIKAGIDLTQIQEQDIQVSGKSITVYVPATKIISFNLPPENIRVEYTDIDAFRQPFTVAERDQLMVQAEQQIRASIPAMGIMEKAEAHTRQVLIPFYQNMGFEEVKIEFGTKAPQLYEKN
jgi:hypothetical protein